jgi:hypothetical protein
MNFSSIERAITQAFQLLWGLPLVIALLIPCLIFYGVTKDCPD